MAQLPFMFSTVPHISFTTSGCTIKKSPSPPPPPSSFRSRYGLLSHHLSLPFCRSGGGGTSAPVSTVSSPHSAPSRDGRFNKCFSMKHSPPRVNSTTASTHLPLSISESSQHTSAVLPPHIMELGSSKKIENTDVNMEDTDDNALILGTQGADKHVTGETGKAAEEAGELESYVLKPSVIDSVRSISDGEIQPAFIDTESKSAVENAVSDMDSNVELEEIDMSEPSVFHSNTTVIHDVDAVLDDVVDNAVSDTEKSMDGDIKCAATNTAKISSVSNEELEQYLLKLSLLYGTDLENSFKDYVSTLKKSDPMELESYRTIPIKKEGHVFAVLRRSRFFVTRKIKNSAMLGIRMLRRDKHNTKKKVIVCTNIVDEAGDEKLWSKPILRGKRCRELPTEEYP